MRPGWAHWPASWPTTPQGSPPPKRRPGQQGLERSNIHPQKPLWDRLEDQKTVWNLGYKLMDGLKSNSWTIFSWFWKFIFLLPVLHFRTHNNKINPLKHKYKHKKSEMNFFLAWWVKKRHSLTLNTKLRRQLTKRTALVQDIRLTTMKCVCTLPI